MTNLKFCGFMDYDDGKIACLETIDDEIPMNIFIDNSDEFDENMEECTCEIEICGIGSEIEIFSSEEEYYKNRKEKMAAISMIPMGTFPLSGKEEDFKQSPHIIFTGKVIGVEWDPSAEPNEPNCDVAVETLGFVFNLYFRYEGKVEIGNIVHGVAWLFGDMSMEETH